MQAPKYLARVSLALGLVVSVFAVLHSQASAQAVTQGYASSSNLQKGTIVMLKTNDPTMIEPLANATINQMQGVIVAANDAPVTLSNDNPSQQQYFVATVGQYPVLVSDQNGPIKSGDYITISSLEGVGMKADTTQPIVLGRAAENFTSNNAITSAKLGSSKIDIGLINVTIAISHNPLGGKNENGIPGILKKAGQLITNKAVNPIRLYLGAIILVASLVVAISMLYSGVRSSLIAVGRNPLAKQSILRNLFQVTLMSLVVFTFGLIAVYLILKL